MNSLIRYALVIAIFFIVAIFVTNDRVSIAAAPPSSPGKNEDPMESVYRAIRFTGNTPMAMEWTLVGFQKRLEEAFRKGDPCMVMALIEDEAPVSPAVKWAAGMEVFLRWSESSDPLLKKLFASTASPIYGNFDLGSEAQPKEILFMKALRASNQWTDGMDGEENRLSFKEVDEAVNSLKALAQEDPENGIYNLFLGQALRLIGAKKEEVESAYVQASKAPKFEAFYQRIYDQLLSSSFTNTATFVWAYAFLHQTPEPNFSNVVRNLKNWAADSEPGKWIASKLAKRMIDLGVKYKAESPGYLISQQEYLLGHSLKYAIDSRISSNREELMAKMKEAKDFISEIPAPVGAAEAEIFMGRIQPNGDSVCNWSSWQNLYDYYRAKAK
jgi:hypothetical protein